MVTLDQYMMGRDKEYPPMPEWIENAKDLLIRVNSLLGKLGFDGVVSSGYRPGSYNIKAGGAMLSGHLMCKAVDLVDSNGMLAKAIMQNISILEEVGLWMEHPSRTSGWVHLDTKKRVNRVFKP